MTQATGPGGGSPPGAWRFTPPPGWPVPQDWTPPAGFAPPADWPPAPADWSYWTWVPLADAPGVYAPAPAAAPPTGPPAVPPAAPPQDPTEMSPPQRSRGRLVAAIAAAVVALLVVVALATSPSPSATDDAGAAASAAPTSSTVPTQEPEASSAPSVVPPPPAPPAATGAPPPAAAGTALAALETLQVRGRGPLTGYSRAQFGPAWADVDRNGCDTRNDMLRRDLTGIRVRSGTNGCVVLSGTLADPYTATRIAFERGGRSEVDIDHVVALGNAWVSGASRWAYGKRVGYANDPLVLLAVDSSANRQKGDGDAATWLPSNRRYWCEYVALQVGIKSKYRLSVTPAEREQMEGVLRERCPTQPVPTGGGPTSVEGFGAPPAASGESSSGGSSGGGSSAGLDPRFATCSAAKAAGFGPYVRGKDPEYDWYRDGDNDGVVCES